MAIVPILLVAYTFLIFGWSTFNNNQSGISQFSVIGAINLTGKVMDYSLVEVGANDPQFSLLKYALLTPGYIDIYARFPLIFSATPDDKNPYMFMGEFSRKTIALNLLTFIKLSLSKIPLIIKAIPTEYNQFFYLNKSSISQSDVALFYYPYLYTWGIIKTFMWPLLAGIFFSLSKLSKNKTSNKIAFTITFLIWMYAIIMVAFAAYDSYQRLRMIVDDLLVLIIIISIHEIVKNKPAI